MPDIPNHLALEQLHAEALRLDAMGAHQHAEPLFAQLLAIAQARLGPHHPDLAPVLNDLARCRFNAGLLLPALHDYRRLLKLLGHDAEDSLIRLTRHQARRCIDGMRQRVASADLQAQLALLIRQARARRAVGETSTQERLRLLARRLIARGRVQTGAQLMQRWLDDLLRAGQPIDDEALTNLHDHAIAVWNAGYPCLAAPMLRDIVRVRQRQQADEPTAWAPALRDWGACLSAAGQARSASETLRLAESVGQAAVRAPADLPEPDDGAAAAMTPPKPKSPWLHGLMLSVLQRCIFIFGLDWEDEPAPLEIRIDGETACVSGAIRFDGSSGPWLPLRLSTPAESEPSFPHLAASLHLPRCLPAADTPERVLAAMAQLSDASGGVTVVCDAASGDITLRSRLVYSGCEFDQHTPAEGMRMIEEVTINMVVDLLCTAQAWLAYGRADRDATPQGEDDDEPTR